MKLEDVILRDTRAAQPLASDVPSGTLYYVTDESVTERSNGTAWESYSDTGSGGSYAPLRRQITLIIDGGGSVITTGFKTSISIPVAGTLKKWRILADVSGSIVIDVWKDTYTNYPPTIVDTITASAKPTLSSATKAESSTLTGWTTSITAGDVFAFNVDSVTSVKKVSLTLEFE